MVGGIRTHNSVKNPVYSRTTEPFRHRPCVFPLCFPEFTRVSRGEFRLLPENPTGVSLSTLLFREHVPSVGIEPTRSKAPEPKSGMSTNSITAAKLEGKDIIF